MGEIKDIRHELDMNTPTAADGAENPEFGSGIIEAEDSLPGPEFIASVDTGAIEGEDGLVVDSLETKESTGEAGGGDAEGGEGEENGVVDADEETATAVEEKVEEETVKEEEPPVVVVEEPRPAFEQQAAMDVEQEKVKAKSLCSCSIM